MTTISTTWVYLVSNLLIFTGILICSQFIHHKIGTDWKFPIVLYYWNSINTALFIVMINIFFNTSTRILICLKIYHLLHFLF